MPDSEIEQPRIRANFVFWWTLATMIGLFLGVGLVVIIWAGLVRNAYATPRTPLELSLIVVVIMGGFLGAAQWLVLRISSSIGPWWIFATIAGLAVCSILTGNSLWPGIPWWINFPVMGASCGFAQWLFLRHHSSLAGWWIPTSIVGWLSFGGVTLSASQVMTASPFLILLFGAALLGAVSGLALFCILSGSDTGQVKVNRVP